MLSYYKHHRSSVFAGLLVALVVSVLESGQTASFWQSGDPSRFNPRVKSTSDNKLGSGTASEYTATMESYAKAAGRYVTDRADFGMFLSASALPTVGRLLASRNIGNDKLQEWSCSGIMLNTEYFLTAGHCFCKAQSRYFKDAKLCKEHPLSSATTYRVFLPGRGMFDIVGAPIVHPDYHSAEQVTNIRDVALADLGIARISGHETSASVSISEIDTNSRTLLASYGYLSFSAAIAGRGFTPGIRYQDGVKQLAGQDTPLFDEGSCPDGGTDTMCIWYNKLVAASGPKQDMSLCGGDSGGPLLQIDNAGKATLIGLSLYYTPAGNDCDPNEDRRSYYLNVSRYKNWLSEYANSAASIPVTDGCLEAIFQGPMN